MITLMKDVALCDGLERISLVDTLFVNARFTKKKKSDKPLLGLILAYAS